MKPRQLVTSSHRQLAAARAKAFFSIEDSNQLPGLVPGYLVVVIASAQRHLADRPPRESCLNAGRGVFELGVSQTLTLGPHASYAS